MSLDQEAIIKQIDDVLAKAEQTFSGSEGLSRGYTMLLSAAQRLELVS